MKQLLTSAILVALSLSMATAFAKTLPLYSEPKSDSKVTGTVNTEMGITIVYTPKNGEWIKVANPTNGDVGWVKSSDLGSNIYNMRVMTTGDGANTVRVYQFGGNMGQISQEQMEKEMKQLENQQRMMQMHMNHLFNNMFYFPQPVFVPVMMVPVPAKVQNVPAVKKTETQKTSQQKVVDKKK